MIDVIVVGGGLSGMLAAREFNAAGAAVTLLEKGELGREASWAGGGILSPLSPWRYSDAASRVTVGRYMLSRGADARQVLEHHFPRFAAELAEETGIDPEWLQSGLLIAEQEEMSAASSWAKRWDVVIEQVSAGRLVELEPGMAPQSTGGLWLPDVAQIRNPRLLKALARSLQLRGVVIKTHAEVMEFVHRDNRVAGVRTRDETLSAGAVVVTAGAWSAALLGTIAAAWKIAPVRGQMLLFHAAPGQVRHIVMKDDHYLVPRRDGRVLAGSTVEYVGFDKSTTTQAYEELRAAATALIPALARCPIEQHWAGLRPGSAQGVPMIGEHPQLRGLYVNAGHFRNGVVTGPASARLLADIIFERAPCVDPVPYRPPA